MKCPFCAEEIKESAVKCKHCGEWLPLDNSVCYPVDEKNSDFETKISFEIEDSKIIINRLNNGYILVFKDGIRIKEISSESSKRTNQIEINGHVMRLKYKMPPSPLGLLTWNSGFFVDIDYSPLSNTASDPRQRIKHARIGLYALAALSFIGMFFNQNPNVQAVSFVYAIFLVLLA